MDIISLLLNDTQINELVDKYKDNIVDNPNKYVHYHFKINKSSIIIYTTKKAVFSGLDALILAQDYQPINDIQPYSHAGSDEVGTGDYFGPVVVCGVIVLESDFNLLLNLKVNDSKLINDKKICEIAPILMEKLTYSILVLNNRKYNEIHNTYNMNAIKAKLHNQVFNHLKNKAPLPKLCVVDQFAPKDLYFKYLKYENDIFTNIKFETKAESKYLAVACASIIARYTFLECWKKLEEKYNFKFNKGANEIVDSQIKEFVNIYGFNKLNEVAKVHFKNTNVIDTKLF